MASSWRLLCASTYSLVFLAVGGGCIGGCSAGSGFRVSTLPDCLLHPVAHGGEEQRADGLAHALTTLDQSAPVSGRPLQILAVTGGITGVPFTGGVLVGWTKSGTRPPFDVVTGISGGALVGAFAFLGPKYDARLEQLILSVRTGDLIKIRPITCLLLDGAFGSAKPSERLLRTEINESFLADLRQAHAEGRRFFVGTMNMQTKQLVTWDVGAIASSGRPDADELVRKVLLAAVSWPGGFPPVEFDVEINGHCYHELHADAGSASMAFVRFGALPGWPASGTSPRPGWLAGSDLYVLASRKLYCDPEPVPKHAVCRIMLSVSAIFEALTRADIARLYCFCAVSGMRFHMLALPEDYHGEPPSFKCLYPRGARQLYEIGHRMGASGHCWRHRPPGALPGEEAVPRDASLIRGCH